MDKSTLSDEAESVRIERAAAARDRDVAALLLHQAELSREAAAADRNIAGLSLHQVSLDRVGHRCDAQAEAQHGPALAALHHEIDRARRTGCGLVVGLVQLRGLTHPNGTRAYLAEVLGVVEAGIVASLRSYDMVVRWRHDEFVYSYAGGDPGIAAKRFEQIRTSFDHVAGDSVRAGFSKLGEVDTLHALISRARADLGQRTLARAS